MSLGCGKCGDVREDRLYGNVDGKLYCSECWKRAGRPWPKRRSDAQMAMLAEQKTREKMLKRGGPDRHLARNNKT